MVNQLPQGWKEVLFNSIFDVCNSGKEKIKQSEYLPKADGLLPVVDQGQNLVSGYSDQFQKVVLAKDNPLIVFGDHTRCVKYIDFDFVVGADGTQLIRTKENTLVKLGYYQLMSANIPNNGYSRHFKYVKEQTYKLIADKGEQKYIVDTLDAVAEMIKLRKETIQLTKDLIPAIFQEMFGDCSENVLIGNNDYFEIEDGDRGNNYPKKEELLEKGDCLFLSAKNVTEDGFVVKENVFISQDKDKKLRTGKLKRYDFVMMTRGTIGNIAYYSPDIPYDNIRINSGMVIIRIKQGFEPLYFLQAMRSDNIKFQINNLITGAAVPQLPIHLIKKISLKLADNTKQKEFADKLEQINQNLEVQQKDLDRLQELFDQLLQKAFTGELTRGEDYGKH